MEFRTDINGLRAVAVLIVLLFHLGFKFFSGGFVGVDVFFVISGFLMTSIICSRLDKKSFSFRAFMKARIKRIVPALLFVILALAAAGYFFFTPVKYSRLSSNALASLGFVSNFIFSNKTDYFANASQDNFLLHTWSLSVEWQFYVLFPWLIIALRKFNSKHYFNIAMLFVFALSFIFAVAFTEINQTKAFFLLPSRIYELLAGSFVYLYGNKFSKEKHISLLGLLLIIAATIFYDETIAFPSFYALLPVIGAVLVLSENAKSRILDNKVMQYFGNISYSLYLWHWPILSVINYLEIEADFKLRLLTAIASIIMAHISYSFIERPFRKRYSTEKLKSNMVYLGACFVAVALFLASVHSSDGFKFRVSKDILEAETEHIYKPSRAVNCLYDYNEKDGIADCKMGNENSVPTIAVWGDSHADVAIKSLVDLVEEKGVSFKLYSYGGCPPILGALQISKKDKYRCSNVNQQTFDEIVGDNNIKDVFIVSRWPIYIYGYNEHSVSDSYIGFDDKVKVEDTVKLFADYKENIIKSLCKLASTGKKVHVFESVPEMGVNVPASYSKFTMIYNKVHDVTIPRNVYDYRNRLVDEALKIAAEQCSNVDVIDVKDLFCDSNYCYGTKDGKALYFDDDHLSIYGSDLLRPLFEKALTNF